MSDEQEKVQTEEQEEKVETEETKADEKEETSESIVDFEDDDEYEDDDDDLDQDVDESGVPYQNRYMEEKRKREALEQKLSQLDTPKEKEWLTDAQIDEMVDNGECSEAQARQYREQRLEAKIEKKLIGKYEKVTETQKVFMRLCDQYKDLKNPASKLARTAESVYASNVEFYGASPEGQEAAVLKALHILGRSGRKKKRVIEKPHTEHGGKTPGDKNKVKLTESQLNLCKKFGITPEDYIKNMR